MIQKYLSAPLLALLIVLLQVSLTLTCAPKRETLESTYLQLNNWDSVHYQSIASEGYRLPDRPIQSKDIHEGNANVVFFPGYPLVIRIFHFIFGLSIPVAMLVVAQFFCWIFWLYFILLLRLYAVSNRQIGMAIFLISIHPAAFYLVVGYTESQFLAMTLGFLYWTDRWIRKGHQRFHCEWYFALCHGALMSLTKLVALASFAYPFLKSYQTLPSKSLRVLFQSVLQRWRTILLGIASTLGSASFFIFSQVQFGDWNVYSKLEELGWENYKRWFALLDPWTYIPRFFFEHTVDSFNRAAVPFTLFLLALALWREKKGNGFIHRIGLYFSSFFLFYVPLTAKANANMDSMIRYTLPSFIFLVLAFFQFYQENGNDRKLKNFLMQLRWLLLLGSILSSSIQIWFIFRFLRGKWVA